MPTNTREREPDYEHDDSEHDEAPPATTHKRDPEAVIARLRGLLALATSDNENEARTAAHQAVRLMKDESLVLLRKETLAELQRRSVEGELARTEKTRSKNENMLVGALIGVVAAKHLAL